MGKIKKNSNEYKKILDDLDKDCNGVIDYSEFLTAAINKQRLLSQENLEIAFQMMDQDKNGVLTVSELRAVFELNGAKDDELWKQVMSEVDKNKDGTISFEEFTQVMN